MDKSKIGAYILNIQHLRGTFHYLKFSKISRFANNLDHIYATTSLKKGEEFYLVKCIPSFAQLCYKKELSRESD